MGKSLTETIKDFEAKERQRKKTLRDEKIKNIGKKWRGVQDWMGKNINPELTSMDMDMGLNLDMDSIMGYNTGRRSSKKKKKKPRNRDIVIRIR